MQILHAMDQQNPEAIYETKYRLLSNRCAEIEQDNDRLINLLYSTTKYVSRAKKSKFLLLKALSKHEDVTKLKFPEFHGFEEKQESDLSDEVKKEMKNPVKKERTSTSSTQNGVKPEGSKKKKKRKDVSGEGLQPKKPMNAYLLFCRVHRPFIQEDHRRREGTEITNSDITKALASKWKSLTDSERDVFQKRYDADKLRYDQDMKAFNSRLSSQQLKPEKQEVVKVEPK